MPSNAGAVQCTAIASTQAASQTTSLAPWQIALPASIGALVLLAILFAVFKLTPGVLEDMSLIRMIKLKRR